VVTHKPALGRGLSALIPSAKSPDTERPGAHVQMVELERLRPNARQPRRRFDDAALAELAQSIRESGLLQPLLVTREGTATGSSPGAPVPGGGAGGARRIPVLVREGLRDWDHLSTL
jgi:ParB family chromosome partitioning protein